MRAAGSQPWLYRESLRSFTKYPVASSGKMIAVEKLCLVYLDSPGSLHQDNMTPNPQGICTTQSGQRMPTKLQIQVGLSSSWMENRANNGVSGGLETRRIPSRYSWEIQEQTEQTGGSIQLNLQVRPKGPGENV